MKKIILAFCMFLLSCGENSSIDEEYKTKNNYIKQIEKKITDGGFDKKEIDVLKNNIENDGLEFDQLMIVALTNASKENKYNIDFCIKSKIEVKIEDIAMKQMNSEDFQKTCDYFKIKEFLGYHGRGEWFNPEKIYELTKINKDFALDLLKSCKRKDYEMGTFQKIPLCNYWRGSTKLDRLQIYTILSRVYKYSDKEIIEQFELNVGTQHIYSDNTNFYDIFLAENLIAKDYDMDMESETEEEKTEILESGDLSRFKLQKEELEHMFIVADLEPEKLADIIGNVSDIELIYNGLASVDLRPMYFDLLKKLVVGSPNDWRFFKKSVVFLEDKGQIDEEFLEQIKAILLVRSLDPNTSIMFVPNIGEEKYMKNEYISIIEKYDYEFAKKISKNFIDTLGWQFVEIGNNFGFLTRNIEEIEALKNRYGF